MRGHLQLQEASCLSGGSKMNGGVQNGSFVWVEEYEGDQYTRMKRKRKVRTRKLEFVGWGSRPLVEFLSSIGKDINSQISRYDAADIVNKYVTDKNLLHPTKKKKVVCDKNLYSIFGKKMISRVKIYDFLGTHYTENHDNSDDDFFFSLEEDDATDRVKTASSVKKIHQEKEVKQKPKSLFAAVTPENFKRVYLKKSLVLNFLEDFGSFETKVVGSFVRIKSDPNDYRQKNPYQLVQVTGFKVSGSNDADRDVHLQVTDFTKDIKISMLLDDNFSQEECEDLRERIKDGLLKRPTIAELEVKARILHEDVMKHWLVEELSLLEKLIARANEKGWRRELSEYLERRQLLQSPEERARLLATIPDIVSDEPETVTAEEAEMAEEPETAEDANIAEAAELMYHNNKCGNGSAIPTTTETSDVRDCNMVSNTEQAALRPLITYSSVIDAAMEQIKQADNITATPFPSLLSSQMQPPQVQVVEVTREVIQLSDDDEEDAPSHQTEISKTVMCMDSPVWYYADPQGDIQGPFSLLSLRRWKAANYFPHDFKVWKAGQTPGKAVLLDDLLPGVSLHQFFL